MNTLKLIGGAMMVVGGILFLLWLGFPPGITETTTIDYATGEMTTESSPGAAQIAIVLVLLAGGASAFRFGQESERG